MTPSVLPSSLVTVQQVIEDRPALILVMLALFYNNAQMAIVHLVLIPVTCVNAS